VESVVGAEASGHCLGESTSAGHVGEGVPGEGSRLNDDGNENEWFRVRFVLGYDDEGNCCCHGE